MLKALRARAVGVGLLLMTVSLGLFGCISAPDSQLGMLEDKSDSLMAQGFQTDEELVGPEREAVLQQALADWRVQGVRSMLESEGRELKLEGAQAFSFKRGSHEGTVVLLPFGDKLLSYMQFRERGSVMLTAHLPGATLRAVNDSQERTVSNESTASVTVEGKLTSEGELTSQQYQPSGSAVTRCSNSGTGSTSCETFFQVSFCPPQTTIIANGSGFHTGTFQGILQEDVSSGSDSVNCP